MMPIFILVIGLRTEMFLDASLTENPLNGDQQQQE